MRQVDNYIIYEEFDYKIDNTKVCNNCIWSNDLTIRKEAFHCKPTSDFEYIVCPCCRQQNFTYLNLTMKERFTLLNVSLDPNFIFAMNQLKQENIVDFNMKMMQLTQQQPTFSPQPQSNVPRCPTCGSTNIKKISGTKRWVGTGLFGLASSLALKSYECLNCSYKW